MESPFQSRRVVRRYRYEIDASPERIFPLLCPVREYDWIDGWTAQVLYSQTGVAEKDCVFMTQRPGRPEATWVVSLYDPPHRIEFAIFHGREVVEKLDVALEPTGGRTALRWARTYTSLCPAGDRFLEAYTGEALDQAMAHLSRALQHYLQTGALLPRA
jgi:hypothetical protein